MGNKKLKFYSLLDFYPRRKTILLEFIKLTTKQKRIYKKYVYSLCFETEEIKDLIWEYLNGWEESYNDLKYQYTMKANKIKARGKNNGNSTSISNSNDNTNAS